MFDEQRRPGKAGLRTQVLDDHRLVHRQRITRLQRRPLSR
jgi:hypothetical protein